MNLTTEFSELISALEAKDVPYALCGGLAVVLHGYPRLTQDIDLLIREEDLQRVLEVAQAHGFDIHAGLMVFKSGTDRETKLYRVTKIEGRDHLMLDLLYVTPAFEKAWETRVRFTTEKRSVWAVSREGLETMKRASGRLRDLVDLQKLGIIPSDEDEPGVAEDES